MRGSAQLSRRRRYESRRFGPRKHAFPLLRLRKNPRPQRTIPWMRSTKNGAHAAELSLRTLKTGKLRFVITVGKKRPNLATVDSDSEDGIAWIIMRTKICKTCGEQKPLSAFYRHPETKNPAAGTASSILLVWTSRRNAGIWSSGRSRRVREYGERSETGPRCESNARPPTPGFTVKWVVLTKCITKE